MFDEYIYVPSIFWENLVNVHANFFKKKLFEYLLLFPSLTYGWYSLSLSLSLYIYIYIYI